MGFLREITYDWHELFDQLNAWWFIGNFGIYIECKFTTITRLLIYQKLFKDTYSVPKSLRESSVTTSWQQLIKDFEFYAFYIIPFL